MKKAVLVFSFLFSLVLFGNAQEYFSSSYIHSGIDSIADGYITVKYHNHSNPVKYTLILGSVIYGNDDFFDVTADTIIQGDSVNNILISSMGSMTQVPGVFEGFKAYAVDSITLDTLGVVLSSELAESYNEIGLDSVSQSLSSTNCDGSFVIDTSAYYSTNPSGNSYLSSQLKYSANFSSDSMTMVTLFRENNQNDISVFPAFEGDSLCPGYYEFASSRGFIVSFTIRGNPNLTASDIDIVQNQYIDCYSSALVYVSHGSGPYTFSWNGEPFFSDSVKENLCQGSHELRVANSIGDTVMMQPMIYALSWFSLTPTLNACLGKVAINFDTITTNLDTSDFQYSWNGSDFSSEIMEDSLCYGEYILYIIDGYGDTLMQNFTIELFEFYINTYSDSAACNAFADITPKGSVFDFIADAGGDTLYVSWNGAPFQLYNIVSGGVFRDSLCEGIYNVALTGEVLGGDTVRFPFAVANNINTFGISSGTSSFYDSVSYYIENCSVDYTVPIDSSSVQSFVALDSTKAVYVVNVWQNGVLTQLSDTVFCFINIDSQVKASFTFYCTLKSNTDVFKVTNLVQFFSMPVGIPLYDKSILSVFPNPVSSFLTIDINQNENFIVSLYSSNGQLVLRSRENKLDLSLLPKGLYLLNYISASANEMIKVIKE
jgi:hypothetical protein